MKKFFGPGIIMMHKLKFLSKFMFISFFLIALLLITLYQFFSTNNANIRFNEMEQYGVTYGIYSKSIVLGVEEHKILVERLKTGDDSVKVKLKEVEDFVDHSYKDLLNYDKTKSNVLDNDFTQKYVSLEIKNTFEEWKKLKSSYKKMNYSQAAEKYDNLLSKLLGMHTDISDNSNLTLDPELDSYYCMYITMFQQLPLSRTLTELDIMGRRLASGEKLQQDQMNKIALYSSRILLISESFKTNMETAFEFNDSRKVKFLSPAKCEFEEMSSVLQSLTTSLEAYMSTDASLYNIELMNGMIDETFSLNDKFYDNISAKLSEIIEKRTNDYKEQNTIVIIAIFIILPIIAYLYIAFALSIMDSVKQLKKSTMNVLNGDLSTVVEIKTNDEIGVIGQNMNKMIAYFRDIIQQLINSEKMVTLGQLVAGVAHEINTPLGAIQASNTNSSGHLEQLKSKFGDLLHALTEENQDAFFNLVNQSTIQSIDITSREQRSYRKTISSKLEELSIEDADDLADTLVDMGIYSDLERYLEVFQSKDKELLVEMAYCLSGLQRNMHNISYAVARASKMVFALKTYAHRGEPELLVEEDVIKSIETVLALYYNQIKQNTELVRNYSEVPKIMCNMDSLNQVWTNIIHNALQAMDYKGTIKIDVYADLEHVIVKIADSGKGIPNEIKDRIFEPFFTTKPAGEGTGLGLDIVKSIIVKHHGNISVESEPGNTVFTIVLPISQPSELNLGN